MRGVINAILTAMARPFRSRNAISLLAVLGVAIGAANIVALISVTDTARYQSFSLMRDLGASAVLVYPFVEGEAQAIFQRANASAFLPSNFVDALKQVPELDRIAAVLLMPGRITLPGQPGVAAQPNAASSDVEPTAGTTGEQSATEDTTADDTDGAAASDGLLTIIEGASPDYPDARGHGVARGRFFDANDEATRARVCCLGAAIPAKLFGAADPMGQEIELKGQRLKVVGVMVEKGVVGLESFDERVFVPLSTAQDIFDLPGIHFIIARTTDPEQVKDAEAAALAKLRALTGLAPDDPPDFTVSTVEEVTGVINNNISIFRLLLYGISSVALLVAGIGIMNVMLMQVMERTREIGIRRAVGARRSMIALQFIAEATSQAIAGTVVGLLTGLAASYAFCYLVHWQAHINPATLVLAAAFSSAVGLLFGVYPAVHAALLKPVDCLRYE